MKINYPYLEVSEGVKRKIFYDKNNYMKVKYESRGQMVHRLIYAHINGAIPDGLTVNHIDGNKHNNNISNLELMTQSENSKHSWENGLAKPCRGECHGKSILDDIKVLTILTMPKKSKKEIGYGVSNRVLSSAFGVSVTRISNIRNGKEWKHIHASIWN